MNSKLFQLVETTSVPGGSHNKILKTFSTRDKAKSWLEENGYKLNMGARTWERELDQDFFAWVYVKIKTVFVDS